MISIQELEQLKFKVVAELNELKATSPDVREIKRLQNERTRITREIARVRYRLKQKELKSS